MKAAEVKAAFPTEAALCDCFLRALEKIGGWTAYPETAGFDILAVYDKTGHQLGVEAKLQLNAKVADQILPSYWDSGDEPGPDFRAVIVPCITESSAGIARMLGMLGVMVWTPEKSWRHGWLFDRALGEIGWSGGPDRRAYDSNSGTAHWGESWFDWNPPKRCRLPEIVPQVRAGVPAPVQLTPWKIGALRVLATLDLDGFITPKAVRECGVDPRRFCASDGWLIPLGDGRWGRGRMPAFDQQHPEAYAQVLAEARAKRTEAAA